MLASLVASAWFASVAVVRLFAASRSLLAALATLLVLVAVLSPSVTDILFRVLPQYGGSHQWVGIRHEVVPSIILIWVFFAIWYLRARRIHPPGWLVGGGHDVLATALVSTVAPQSRNEALQRQLLGGTTVIRLGAQWFVILGFLLGLQWLLAKSGTAIRNSRCR